MNTVLEASTVAMPTEHRSDARHWVRAARGHVKLQLTSTGRKTPRRVALVALIQGSNGSDFFFISFFPVLPYVGKCKCKFKFYKACFYASS